MGIGIQVLAIGTTGTTGTQVVTAGTCATLYIQADISNGAKILAIGPSAMTTYGAAYSIALSAGQSWTYLAPYPMKPGGPQIDISKFYVAGSAAGTVYHVSYLERMG
jgi:hypothetical protein